MEEREDFHWLSFFSSLLWNPKLWCWFFPFCFFSPNDSADKSLKFQVGANENQSISLAIGDMGSKAITSDNPSFITENIDKKHMHIMPITPKMLACMGKNGDKGKKYLIEVVNNKEVRKINYIKDEMRGRFYCPIKNSNPSFYFII